LSHSILINILPSHLYSEKIRSFSIYKKIYIYIYIYNCFIYGKWPGFFVILEQDLLLLVLSFFPKKKLRVKKWQSILKDSWSFFLFFFFFYSRIHGVSYILCRRRKKQINLPFLSRGGTCILPTNTLKIYYYFLLQRVIFEIIIKIIFYLKIY
jgi:hypothetical protein